MKYSFLIIFLLAFAAILQPVRTARSQVPERVGKPYLPPYSDQAKEDLKAAILANMDTAQANLKEVEKEKTVIKRENRVLRQKLIKAREAPVMRDTLVIIIDTCVTNKNVIYDSIELNTPQKRVKWYKKIFQKHG